MSTTAFGLLFVICASILLLISNSRLAPAVSEVQEKLILDTRKTVTTKAAARNRSKQTLTPPKTKPLFYRARYTFESKQCYISMLTFWLRCHRMLLPLLPFPSASTSSPLISSAYERGEHAGDVFVVSV